jgi:Fe-S-cluster-containing hydrogenase component 2
LNTEGKVKKIVADTKVCKECLTCMYTCSIVHYGESNLSKSRIVVLPGEYPYIGSASSVKIDFTNDCVLCQSCVRACPYGALSVIGGEM